MKIPSKIIRKLTSIYGKMGNLFLFGDYDKALEFFEESEIRFKDSPRELRKEAEQLHCQSLMIVSIIFSYRGDLASSFEVIKKILKIAEEIDDEYCFSLAMYGFGRYNWLSGDLIKALEYFDRAIELERNNKEIHKVYWFLTSIMMAVRVSIAMGDLKIAQEYYKQVEMSQANLTSPVLKDVNEISKALILKSSSRFRDRAIAEDLFKEIINNKSHTLNNRLLSLVDLCELLLNELRVTNDINIIEEIKPLIAKLLDFAKKINSFYYLIEANLLQAKLALINFEISNARRFLIQAQRLAERHGYTKLVTEIVELQEELMQQSETWDYLQEIDAPISKRMELARLSENLNELIRVQKSTTVKISEQDVTVYKERKKCLVCLGDIEGFDNYICPNCDSIYCRKCANALIEMENVCWSCESPIDRAKPVKYIRIEKEKVDKKNKKNEEFR
ncbi:MAG: hypothetical protein ACFFCV_03535 [Promethearchaeota archaeon]